MIRARIGALLAVPLVLLGCAACRDTARHGPTSPTAPGASVEQELGDIESTLDNIESEVNSG